MASLPEKDGLKIAPIRCEKCAGLAQLILCEIVDGTHAIKEVWTYRCASCGHEMTRKVGSSPPTPADETSKKAV